MFTLLCRLLHFSVLSLYFTVCLQCICILIKIILRVYYVMVVVGWWCRCLSGARCRLAYSPADPLPLTVSCFSKIQIGCTFLVLAHLGSPRKRAVKQVCVCVCVMIAWIIVQFRKSNPSGLDDKTRCTS